MTLEQSGHALVLSESAGYRYLAFGALHLLLKWLKRRSQRRSYTWPGFTAIVERFKVERPRLVGHPKRKKAPAMA